MEVLLTSPWIPPEWIAAHGLQPRGACAPGHLKPHGQGLGAGVCAFAQAVLKTAERNQRFIIFSTHCDQLRRSFDALGAGLSQRSFLFNLPSTCEAALPEKIFRVELERLGRYLTELGGRPPAETELLRTMEHYAGARKWLLDAAGSCPAEVYSEALAQFHWDGSAQPPAPAREAPPAKVPLALVGGPLPVADREWFRVLEEAGGQVVLDGTEWGERSLLPGAMPEGTSSSNRSESALGKLAHRYAATITDVFQRPNSRLYQWLKERLKARRVRGILLWHFVGCDLWRAEASTLRETFRLPVLLVEADECGACANRTAGRIQAFVESICA